MPQVNVKINLSQTQAGKLYMKSLKLEDENKAMRALLLETVDFLDTNDLTSIAHNSILHRKFRELVS